MTGTATTTTAARRIMVSGDLVVDHDLYAGERATPTARGSRGVQHLSAVGGAEGLRVLLETLKAEAARQYDEARAARETTAKKAADDAAKAGKTPKEAEAAAKAARDAFPPFREPIPYTAAAGLELPDRDGPHAAHHAVAIWKPFALDRDNPSKGKVWRVGLKMGYGQDPLEHEGQLVLRPAASEAACDFLVLDDAGFAFRRQEHKECWHLPRPGTATPWILLKLSEPIAQGDLWRALVPSGGEDNGYADRLVCLVSAQDLRREAVRITPGVSWERTLEDLSDELCRAVLAPLTRCRHLVVAFDAGWKDDNIEAARRIPSVLALAGLGIERLGSEPPAAAPDEETLTAHLRHNLERLAEAEHDGWWEYRRRNGWTQGVPRDDVKRIHPLMVPYAQLSEAIKAQDREMVMRYPERLGEVGYRVVWLGA